MVLARMMDTVDRYPDSALTIGGDKPDDIRSTFHGWATELAGGQTAR
jgi:hypothetical protein